MIQRLHGSALAKIVSLFTIVCLLLVPFQSVVEAAASTTPSLAVEVDETSYAPGDMVTVSVTVDPGDEDLIAYDTNLNYDANRLELVNVTDKAEAQEFTTDASSLEQIIVSAAYFSDNYFISSKQEVFDIQFKIKENAGAGEANIQIESGQYSEDYDTWTDFASLSSGNIIVQEVIHVKVGTVTGAPGETVEVPVSILEANGSTAAYGMQLDFDSNALAVEKITGLSGDTFSTLQNDLEGWLKVCWVDAEGGDNALKEGDTLFKISFKIKENAAAGDVPITVSNQEDPGHLTFTNVQLEEMKKTVIDGKVTINAALTNAEAPSITTQPIDRTVNVGDSAELNILANASGTVSYQWYSNDTNLTDGATMLVGETSNTLTVPTMMAGSTYYFAVVTNTDSTKTGQIVATQTSSIAKVTVDDLTDAEAPTLITEPTDQTVSINEPVILKVDAVGSGSISYQWYQSEDSSEIGGMALTGETGSSLAVPTFELGTTYYYVVVTNIDSSKTGMNASSVTSRVAKVVVNELSNAPAPLILLESSDQNVNVNDPVNLMVHANGTGVLSYQWYVNDSNSTVDGTPIFGATQDNYTVSTEQPSTSYYYVTVTNTDDSQTGNKTSTATSRPIKVTISALTAPEDNHLPIATDDVLPSIPKGKDKVTILFTDLTGNDSVGSPNEQDTQTLTITNVSELVGGTASIREGYIEFIPDPGFTGLAKFKYTVSDGFNSATAEVTFEINDLSPSISLLGDTTIYLLKGQQFIEPGYSAANVEGQDLTENVIVTHTEAETEYGTYQIKYNVSDSENRAAQEKTRTIYVVSNYLTELKAGTKNLSPSFSSAEENYSITVNNNVSTLPITAALEDTHATLTIDGQIVNSGVAKPVELSVGKNTVTVVVTTHGGLTKTYTLTITRQVATTPTNPGNTGGNSSGGSTSSGDTKPNTPVPTTPVTEDPGTTSPASNNNDIFRPEVVEADSNVVSNISSMVQKYATHPEGKSGMVDIQGHWGEKTLTIFSKLGVLKGYEDGTSKPNNSITRGEFAALIDRIFVVTAGTNTEHLKDLNGYWGSENIHKLTSAGVLKGYGDDTFRPNNTISRQEMVVILSRVVNMSLVKSNPSSVEFKDIDVSYAANEIKKAAEIGIIEGKEFGVFDPKGKATRTEALQIILNTLNLHSEIKELLESL
ncbi:S-layer homology domain-containing protein [Paenibacillus illinoisensis]|uniref:S-layer homology domain-containing protein n=1 Tax=Paenibacillus illinoisensis TaxID=59845 RepID=UPI003CF7ED30